MKAFLAEKLGPLSYDGPSRMFERKQRIAFKSLGQRKTADTILNMPLGSAYLFTRGERPRTVRKYDVRTPRRRNSP